MKLPKSTLTSESSARGGPGRAREVHHGTARSKSLRVRPRPGPRPGPGRRPGASFDSDFRLAAASSSMPRFFELVSAGVQVELQLQQADSECIGFIQNFKFNNNFRVWPRPLPVGERPRVDSECSYTAAGPGRGRSGEIPGAIRLLTLHWHVNIVQDLSYEPETHARGLTPGTRGFLGSAPLRPSLRA
jgi:hypothetical protein